MSSLLYYSPYTPSYLAAGGDKYSTWENCPFLFSFSYSSCVCPGCDTSTQYQIQYHLPSLLLLVLNLSRLLSLALFGIWRKRWSKMIPEVRRGNRMLLRTFLHKIMLESFMICVCWEQRSVPQISPTPNMKIPVSAWFVWSTYHHVRIIDFYLFNFTRAGNPKKRNAISTGKGSPQIHLPITKELSKAFSRGCWR